VITTLSWIATVVTIVSVWLLGRKKIEGWVFGVLGCLLWAIYGYITRQPALVVVDLILLLVNIEGYLNWREDS
jgi:nicotinamide riboside transporter PnuC